MSNPADTSSTERQDVAELRRHLFETLQAVRAGSIDLDRAKMVNDIGRTLIESARVEVAFLEATGGERSAFLEASTKPAAPALSPPPESAPQAPQATWPPGVGQLAGKR